MRWIISLLAMTALAFSSVAHAGKEKGSTTGVLEVVPDQYDNEYGAVFRLNGCIVIAMEKYAGYDISSDDLQEDRSSWSGACAANGMAEGKGVLKLCVFSDGFFDRCTVEEGIMRNGLLQGRVHYWFEQYNDDGSIMGNKFESWEEYNNGCPLDPNNERNSSPCDTELGPKLQTRYLTSASGGSVRAVASATGGAVGQNRGKGGNPDWMYDDADHGKCISVQPARRNTGSGLAYGHYKLINNCAYPIKIRTCITTDRADGSESNYDLHQDGAKCPGMGWLGGDMDANEVQNGREWFEYNRLKWDIQVCREGWSFVGRDGVTYPGPLLGEEYGCRMRRPSE